MSCPSSPTKRKRSPSPPPPTPTSNSLPLSYIALLNTAIQYARTHNLPVLPPHLPHTYSPSSLGTTQWTSSQKVLFFTHLPRTSRHNLDILSARVGKSVVEISQYLMLLEEVKEKWVVSKRGKRLRLAEVEGAVEVAEDVVRLETRVAEAVGKRWERHEELAEKSRWGAEWKVDREIAGKWDWDIDRMEKAKATGQPVDSAVTERIKELPGQDLFYYSAFPELSTSLFMNSLISDYNWHVISPTESPSLRSTALSDLHNLITIAMKKIIAECIAIAQGRLDAKGGQPVVHRRDVLAAIENVGVGQSRQEKGKIVGGAPGGFWVGVPRRIRMRVVDDGDEEDEGEVGENLREAEGEEGVYSSEEEMERSRSPSPAPSLDYDELEATLLPPPPASSEGSNSPYAIPSPLRSPSPLFPPSPSSPTDPLAADIAEVLMYTSVSLGSPADAESIIRHRLKTELKDEEEAERLDGERAIVEEEMLRSVLSGGPVPEGYEEEIETKVERRKGARSMEGLLGEGMRGDWREKVEYVPEWESLL